MKGVVNGLKVELDEWWKLTSALVWLCSVNGERTPAYLINVGGGKYLVVVVSMVLVSIYKWSEVRISSQWKQGMYEREWGVLSERVRDCLEVEMFFSCLLLLGCSSCFSVMASLLWWFYYCFRGEQMWGESIDLMGRDVYVSRLYKFAMSAW